jgi:ATP-dependent exoDNAse (exonuclease V) alpha subunit
LATKLGGRIVKLKTDCVFIEGGNTIDSDDKIGGYHLETIKPSKHFNRVRSQKPNLEMYIHDNPKWKDICRKRQIVNKNVKPMVKSIINKNESLLMTGMPGSGKSYIIKHIINRLDELDKTYAICAPTGKAAINIGGTTIHKVLKLADGKIPKERLRFLKSLDYMIIDEISMMSSELYLLLISLKKLTKIKFILVGDFDQLPPVEQDNKKYDYRNAIVLKELADSNRIVLTENRRSDATMFNLLQKLKKGDKIDLNQFKNNTTLRNICYTNNTRRLINKRCMKQIKATGVDYIEIKNEDDKDVNAQDVCLFVGSPIVGRRNNCKYGIVNSEMYHVIRWNDKSICINNGCDGDIELAIKDFQKNVFIAYATTVHKSQGETINEPYTIYEWDRMYKQMKYTALSRTTDIEHINIVQTCIIDNRSCTDNISKKIDSHLAEDKKKKRRTKNFVTVEYIQQLLEDCKNTCQCCHHKVKTSGYSFKDLEQFSIERINNKLGHIQGNVKISCMGCNISR